MKTAFLFDGQGTQHIGMGGDVYRHSTGTRDVCERVSQAVGFDVVDVALNGTDDDIKNTRNAQACLYALEKCIEHILVASGVKPDIVAGYSFGQYPAIVAAGGLSFEDGLHLVNRRGVLMAESASRKNGAMAIISGLSLESIREEIARMENIHVACFNSDTEHFLAGERSTLEPLVKSFKARGVEAGMVPLKVTGHCPYVEDASIIFKDELMKASFKNPAIPIVVNVTASVATTASDILADTLGQMLEPVQWYETMKSLLKAGVERFIEVGPGHGLKRMGMKASSDAVVFTTRNMEEIEDVIGKMTDSGGRASDGASSMIV